MRPFKTLLILTLALSALPVFLHGQESNSTVNTLFSDACKLQQQYSFEEAEDVYNELLTHELEPALKAEIHSRITQCQNGYSLLEYIVRPVSVATKDCSIENFFLHIKDSYGNSWMPVPNPFVNIPSSAANPFCCGTYFNTQMETAGSIIYSAPNEAGQWKIYTSSRIDSTLWSAPQLLSANISSAGNEIFPYLSPDGSTLYFASDALAGMGGYDLFYSTLDPSTGSWSAPENLGFPYSSTGNDIFYADSRDGKFTVIVSDRETSEGNVRIYVTPQTANAVRTVINDGEDPAAIASMKGTGAPMAAPGKTAPAEDEPDGTQTTHEDSLTTGYLRIMGELEELLAAHSEKLEELDEERAAYENADAVQKQSLSEGILALERETMSLKKQIDRLTKDVQKAELHLIANGIAVPQIIKADEQQEAVETTAVADSQETYVFPDNKFRNIPYIVFEQIKPKFDYGFKVGRKDEGRFAEDQSLPDGIVYQIQFAVLTKKASIKDLKGLSPVYAFKQSSGKYIHTVGLFKTYEEGSSKVKAVRNAGFKEAFLVAYKNGKSISVKTARQQEGKSDSGNTWQVVISGYDDALPAGIISAIREASHKDISKTAGNDGTKFIVGPFSKESDASSLADLLKGLGVNGITIENINIKQ